MAEQAHHFRIYAKEKIDYAIDRYTHECKRLYGVMDKRLTQNEWLAGDVYSIADIACVGWIARHERQGQDLNDFPHVRRWFETMNARPAVQRGLAVAQEIDERANFAKDETAQNVLFGQKAR